VWLQKEAIPRLPAAVELALMCGTRYVVDFDDAWFHRYDAANANVISQKFRVLKLVINDKNQKPKERQLIRTEIS
jgi:single-stranded DNA-specific DHH superfamily exonuclease